MTNAFISWVVRKTQATLGEGYAVSKTIVTKNNDTRKIGIIIRENGSNVSPTIYIDEMEGNTTEVAAKVIEIYKANQAQTPSVDTSEITDWEKAKDKIYPRLVNAKANKLGLEKLVHTDLLDLSVIYALTLGNSPDGSVASVRITNDLLKGYGVSADELHAQALANLDGTSRLTDMMSMLFGLMEGSGMDTAELESMELNDPMWVLTNADKMHGASSILDTHIMETVREKLGNFYIIPSSIHEVIIISANAMPADELANMIKEVNSTQVAPDEVLSDHPYIYNENGLQVA